MARELYTDQHGNTFEILGISMNIFSDNKFIHYKNITTGQEYNCLSDAFFERFDERVQ